MTTQTISPSDAQDMAVAKQALADMSKIMDGLRKDIDERGGEPVNQRSAMILGCLCTLYAAGLMGGTDLAEAFDAMADVSRRALARYGRL